MKTLTAGDALVIQQLYQNLIDYWVEVDLNGGRNAATYYTDDGVFDGGVHKQVGRAAIAAFYQWRSDRGPRLSRHLVTNFRVDFKAADEVVCTWTMLLHAADGQAVLPSLPAIAISDVTDVCIQSAHGQWLYKSRTFNALFKGGAPTTVPPAGGPH